MNDTEQTWPPRRRANDPLVDHLHECVEGLKTKVSALEQGVAENTANLDQAIGWEKGSA